IMAPDFCASSIAITSALVAALAKISGLNSTNIEIRPPRKSNETWMVGEVDRSWPTHLDSIAVNPSNLAVTSKVTFQNFPLMAKLTRWGIDFHMGSLFGAINQIILMITTLGFLFLVVTGYYMWIKRKPWKLAKKQTLFQELKLQRSEVISTILVFCIVLGYFLPLFFISLLLFMFLETLILKLKEI
ncbi:MAG: PepSY domain-containing protein, partial [Bdellovibrionales bacterium]|nr:PepSY domain-containing protein [Bdellovibrionales bacterium]